MKTLFLCSTLFGLMACTADKAADDTGETGETGETGTTLIFTQSEAQVAHISAALPFFAWKEATNLALPGTGPCPHVSPTADDSGLIVTGDCTDEQGIVYTGGFLYSPAETGNAMVYDFSDFTIQNQAHTLGMNGPITLDFTADMLYSNLSIEMSDSRSNIQLSATYTDHALGPLIDIAEFFGGRAGSFSSTGTVDILDVDRFSLTGTFENTDQCTQEGDDVVLVFEGERGTIRFVENAEACDGCADWTDGVTNGQICMP